MSTVAPASGNSLSVILRPRHSAVVRLRRAPFHWLWPGVCELELVDLDWGAYHDLAPRHAVLVLPWHNPVLLAEQVATLDLLSGGRVDFGIGKGYRYNEFAGFCVPMEAADARFDECVEVMTRAWTSDAPWSHRGKYWQFEDVAVEPPTAQKPHPPLWMGAGSPASIKKWPRWATTCCWASLTLSKDRRGDCPLQGGGGSLRSHL